MKEIKIILLTLLALVFSFNDMQGRYIPIGSGSGFTMGTDTITVDSLLYEIRLPKKEAWCYGSSDTPVVNAVIANTVMYKGIEYPVTYVRKFQGDPKRLKSVVVGDNVKEIAPNAFRDFSSLESVVLGKSVLALWNGVFRGCTSLKDINLPESLTVIDSACFFKSGLESISIPRSIELINSGAFYGCPALTTVTIPNTRFKLYQKDFGLCPNLRTIYCYRLIPPESIYDGLFKPEYAYNSESVEIGVTQPELITLHVPQGCYEAYANSKTWKQVGTIIADLEVTSGIDDINVSGAIDDAKPVEVYNLQGQKVGDDTSGLPKGLYIIRQGAVTEKRIVR